MKKTFLNFSPKMALVITCPLRKKANLLEQRVFMIENNVVFAIEWFRVFQLQLVIYPIFQVRSNSRAWNIPKHAIVTCYDIWISKLSTTYRYFDRNSSWLSMRCNCRWRVWTKRLKHFRPFPSSQVVRFPWRKCHHSFSKPTCMAPRTRIFQRISKPG